MSRSVASEKLAEIAFPPAFPLEKQMNEALELIRQLARERFYGALTLKFEAGRITTIKKEQTIKTNDLSEQPRNENDTTDNQ